MLSQFDAFVPNGLQSIEAVLVEHVFESFQSFGPFDFVIVFQVTRQVGAAGEFLRADVALKPPLCYARLLQIVLTPVLLEALEADGGEIASVDVALVSALQLVIVEMLGEIVVSLGHVGTARAAMRPILGVLVLDVMPQICRKRASHVAERAFVVVHVLAHVVAQESLQAKLF